MKLETKFTTYCNNDLKKALEDTAKLNGISVNVLVQLLLNEGLKNKTLALKFKKEK